MKKQFLTLLFFRDELVDHLTVKEYKRGVIIKVEYDFKRLREICNFERNDCLHIASEKGHEKVVNIIMRKGHEATVLNKQYMNALHVAVKGRHLSCVKAILDNLKKDVDKEKKVVRKQRDINNHNTIMLAITKKKQDIVEELLEAYKKFGYESEEKKREERRELMNFCAENGEVGIMKSLHKALDDGHDLDLDEPLHFAVKANKEDIVQYLISRKADVNKRNEDHDILPMELAVKSGHEEIVDILKKNKSLEWKKFYDKQNELNVNLIHYAVRSDKYQMIKNLNDFLTKQQPGLCKIMLKGKEYEDGNTPIHEACSSKLSGQDIREFLTIYDSHKLKIDQLKNDRSQTPLHIASKSGHLDHVRALLGQELSSDDIREVDADTTLKLGEDDKKLLNAMDVDGNRAIHIAAEHCQSHVFKYLLEASEDHKPSNSFGRSPLHVIAEFGAEGCLAHLSEHVRVKLGKKMNVNTKDSQGNTPLHLASRNGHSKMVKSLLALGSDVVILDQKGKNALQIAMDNHQEDIVRTIIESGCWEDSLRAGFLIKDGFQKILDTPMRQLIRHFPEVAETALDKCKEETEEVSQIKTTFYNYEFLEDTYKYKLVKEENEYFYKHVTDPSLKRREETKEYFVSPYTFSGNIYVSNHPLMKINDYKQQKLLIHDVTKNLINDKWKSFGSFCYYINLLFYMCFLAILTTNVMTSIWPQKYPALYSCSPYFDDTIYTHVNQSILFPENVLDRNSYNYASRWAIAIFAGIRLFFLLFGHERKWITQVRLIKINNISVKSSFSLSLPLETGCTASQPSLEPCAVILETWQNHLSQTCGA